MNALEYKKLLQFILQKGSVIQFHEMFQKYREINSFSNKSYYETVKKIHFFVKPMRQYDVVNFIEILFEITKGKS